MNTKQWFAAWLTFLVLSFVAASVTSFANYSTWIERLAKSAVLATGVVGLALGLHLLWTWAAA